MTIALDRLLAHMAWANQKTIEHLQTLPGDALKAFATNPEWFAGEIVITSLIALIITPIASLESLH